MLHTVYPDAKKFPKHQEIRFAEYQVRLVDAVLNNLPACKDVWSQLETNGIERKWKPMDFQELGTINILIWMAELMATF